MIFGEESGALAAAEFLCRAARGYRSEARAGRTAFAVDELMAAGIDNADLLAASAPPHLETYLRQLRERAAAYFETAAQALPRAQRAPQRHLLVLAALGRAQLHERAPSGRRRSEAIITSTIPSAAPKTSRL